MSTSLFLINTDAGQMADFVGGAPLAEVVIEGLALLEGGFLAAGSDPATLFPVTSSFLRAYQPGQPEQIINWSRLRLLIAGELRQFETNQELRRSWQQAMARLPWRQTVSSPNTQQFVRFAPSAEEVLKHLRPDRGTKRVDSRGVPVAEGSSATDRRGTVLQAAGKTGDANATPASPKIPSQADLIKRAKTFAADREGLGEYIKDYGIESQDALVEIAKIAAATNGWETSEHIQNYGIESEAARIEIAKIAAAQCGWATSKYIRNYGIQSQEALVEIAKIAAAKNGGETSEYIQNYGIQSQGALVEIANIAAARNGEGTLKFIDRYGIQSQDALGEIVRIAVAPSGIENIAMSIQNYGIKPEAARVEIAKIAAAQLGWGVSANIQDYGIESEAARIEIAKIDAAQHGWNISENIQNYGIESEAARVEIAKIAAAQNEWAMSKYIRNYGIQSQVALIEIAKIAAAQSGEGLSVHIQNYGIQSEAARIEIAKIAAAQSGESLSVYIQNYGIESEAARVEIAKIAAAGEGEWTSNHIQNYGIQSQAARVEIAKIADVAENLYKKLRKISRGLNSPDPRFAARMGAGVGIVAGSDRGSTQLGLRLITHLAMVILRTSNGFVVRVSVNDHAESLVSAQEETTVIYSGQVSLTSTKKEEFGFKPTELRLDPKRLRGVTEDEILRKEGGPFNLPPSITVTF